MNLTEAEVRTGIIHIENHGPTLRSVIELAAYGGEEQLTINCTQLGDSLTPQFASAKEKKRILREWCDHLKADPTRFTELRFGTRMPQELFDAVCHQRRLVKLVIKWGVYEDLSALEKLQDLRVLYIGSGARVPSIAPFTKLPNLVGLSVENFQKVTDYAALAQLRTLRSLDILGDVLSPHHIKVDSLEFLTAMPQLQFFRLLTARLQSKDYRPLLALQNLEHLTLDNNREVKTLYGELAGLPRLKWGSLKERPELYRV